MKQRNHNRYVYLIFYGIIFNVKNRIRLRKNRFYLIVNGGSFVKEIFVLWDGILTLWSSGLLWLEKRKKVNNRMAALLSVSSSLGENSRR